MKKILILIFVLSLIFVVSCVKDIKSKSNSNSNYPKHSTYYTEGFNCDGRIEDVRKYSLECMSRAGKSEPEDRFYKCKSLAKKLYCERTTYRITLSIFKRGGRAVETNREALK